MPRPSGSGITVDGGTQMAGAWIVVGIAAIVVASIGRGVDDVFRYSLVLVALFLLLTNGDRFAGPLYSLARSLGGRL